MSLYRFSYLITYRESDQRRRQNLCYVLKLLSLDPTLEVIVVEQDTFAHFDAQPSSNFKYLFVESDASFNKSWGLNIAAAMASCDRLIFADADILLNATALDESFALMNQGAEAIKPYNSLADLSPSESEELITQAQAVHINRPPAQLNRKPLGQHPPFCGGAFAITRTLFKACGGMDERFEGWGGEDDAMSKRLAHFATNLITLDLMAFHLWHPSSNVTSNVTGDSAPRYIRNLALLTMYYERGATFYQQTAQADALRNAAKDKYKGAKRLPTSHKQDPLVSCLCVTRGRVGLLERAIKCFMEQSYPNKELMIVTESDDHETNTFLARIKSKLVKQHVVPSAPKSSLGALRNRSITLAQGEYICQWDDDDWYHPDRIAKQIEATRRHNKGASILPRWLIHETQSDKFYCSNIRLWEGSLLCHKSILPLIGAYDLARQGEDSRLIETLFIADQIAIEDNPDLYVYCVRGENTWDAAHFKKIIESSIELSAEETDAVRSRITV